MARRGCRFFAGRSTWTAHGAMLALFTMPIVIPFRAGATRIGRTCQNTAMSIRNQTQLERLRRIGRIVRMALDRTAAAVRPGITTAELDAIGARVLAEHRAESAPPRVYGFPGALCI